MGKYDLDLSDQDRKNGGVSCSRPLSTIRTILDLDAIRAEGGPQ